MAQKQRSSDKSCKDNQKSTQLNEALAELMKQAQRVYAIAVDENNLPTEEDVRQGLKSLANRLSETLTKFSKDLQHASAKGKTAVKEPVHHATKEYEKQALRLHEDEAFKTVGEGVKRIQSAMAETLKETAHMMEKLRPQADAAAQQVKTVVQEKLKEMNKVGEELAKEVEKAMNDAKKEMEHDKKK